MLPSMPILFSRESQDAFGNKIEPSTSFFSQNSTHKPVIIFKPPPVVVQEPPKVQKEVKNKKEPDSKKKDDPPKGEDNDLVDALVRSYYSRVQSRFSSNHSDPTNKYVQFQNILCQFDPNKETPVELFRKVEQLFREEHQDIVEDFLLFLKPGQAAQVGRFMDRFMLVQITGFIEMLHATFSRKPTVLRKVMRAITNGFNSGNSEEVKARVLPHFRSHPRLVQAFKSLFPDERPPDSVYESGVEILNENFLTNDKGYDVWEFQNENDKKPKLEAKQGLDTMYLNGRVFLQHGRLLRNARVTFPYSKEPYRVHARRLAATHNHISPSDSDEDTKKKPRKRPRKQNKSPTKKDVNDNTKKDNPMMSPKPKKSQKTKNGKKEDKTEKRKDSKTTVQKKEESKSKQAKIEASVSVETKKVKSNNWTRDEDKTMLQVLKGEAGSEKVFGRIKELLPHRSPTEIKERFCHVMTLLQQMAVAEVT